MDSWRRRHSGDGITLALAIWLNGRCEASVYVYESPFVCTVPERVVCDTTDEAKARADELLKNAYPHDCDVARCDPWVPFVQPPALGR